MNEQETVSESKVGFESLHLSQATLRGVLEAGYSTMFPIQAEAIPPLLSGKDLIGQAHTGSGKTAAYSIPMMERLDGTKAYIQALVLVPTRELALQVVEEFNKLAKYASLRGYPIYGGQSITPQIERLRKRTPQIIVATPGRLIDHMERGTIDFRDIRTVILDEADRMLDMGFIEDIDYIMKKIPTEAQVALFSATMPEEIRRLSQRYMNSPLEVLIDSDEISLESIEQKYFLLDEKDKFNALTEYLKRGKISSGIIFCGMKFRAQRLAERLQRAGFRAAPIHGDLSQNQREHTMRNFRSGYVELLVATDVAARGIDVPAVSHVINYDVPQDPLTYFHRIGRTARAGRGGSAFTLVSGAEYPDFNRIVAMTQVPITKLTGLTVPESTHREFERENPRDFRRSYGRYPRRRSEGYQGRDGRRFEKDGKRPQESGERFSFTERVGPQRRFPNRRYR
jgi:ATP-dependent RNA helicase DeaD